MKDGLLTINEAIRESTFGRTRLYRGITDGTLPAIKIGRRTYVRKEALEAWIKGMTKEFRPTGNRFGHASPPAEVEQQPKKEEPVVVENEPEDILYSVALFFEKQDGQTTRQRLFNCVVVAKDRDAALGKGISKSGIQMPLCYYSVLEVFERKTLPTNTTE